MPGMNLIQLFDDKLANRRVEIESALNSLFFLSEESNNILLETQTLLLSVKVYSEYPTSFWENNQFCFFLEGRIYNKCKKQLIGELEIIAESIFKKNCETTYLTSWLLESEGEFIVWVYEKETGHTILVNDVFARLPVYYYHCNNMLLVARDLRFITTLIGITKINRLALAQYFLLGHSLGKLTIWHNIFSLTPASIMIYNSIKHQQLTVNTLYSFNFSSNKHRSNSLEQNASNLFELFGHVCKERTAQTVGNVLSLSNGLDSRTVAAGLFTQNIHFSSATFYRPGYNSKQEINGAKALAELFNSSWRVIELPALTNQSALELLQAKNGMNFLEIAFIINFLKKIKEVFGSKITYLTGDGGDITIPLLIPRASWSVRSLNSLVKLVIGSNYLGNYCFSINDASAMTGVPTIELFASIANHILEYPEKTWFEKMIHYKIYGRIVKIYNEGEDRNRCYFWSTTPFYSNQFFNYAMNCPNEQKNNYALYLSFLNILSPAACNMNYSDTTYSPISGQFKMQGYINQLKWLAPYWSKLAKKKIRGVNSFYKDDTIVDHIIKHQIDSCQAIQEYFNIDCLKKIINRIKKYEKKQIFILFTSLAAIEYLTCHQSSLQYNPETEIAHDYF